VYCVAYENIVVLTRVDKNNDLKKSTKVKVLGRVDKNNDLKKSTKVKVLGHVKRSYTNASVSS